MRDGRIVDEPFEQRRVLRVFKDAPNPYIADAYVRRVLDVFGGCSFVRPCVLRTIRRLIEIGGADVNQSIIDLAGRASKNGNSETYYESARLLATVADKTYVHVDKYVRQFDVDALGFRGVLRLLRSRKRKGLHARMSQGLKTFGDDYGVRLELFSFVKYMARNAVDYDVDEYDLVLGEAVKVLDPGHEPDVTIVCEALASRCREGPATFDKDLVRIGHAASWGALAKCCDPVFVRMFLARET